MNANAEILLVRDDGSVILQVRDTKPGITNSGLISSIGGQIEDGEDPIDAAVREINEETNLNLAKDQLQFYRKCFKTMAVHGEDWEVHYYVAQHMSEAGLEVYEGQGYTIIHNKQELAEAKTSILLKAVLTDYFDGFRAFIFFPDAPKDKLQAMLDEYYAKITEHAKPTQFTKPVALACTGLVAAGKSTVTAPLATMVGAVQVSSDLIREMFFLAHYNFSEVRPFIRRILERLVVDKFNIFLDFNISTNIDVLDALGSADYQIYVVHANPPESFIKQKILTGNMKHELSFFPKDEFLYESMLGWRQDHFRELPILQQKYGIWYEVDTSRQDLPEEMARMQAKFKKDVGLT